MNSRLLTGIFLVFLSVPAIAASYDTLGHFGIWQAYAYTDDAQKKVCFMRATPTDTRSSKQGAKRGEVTMTVTHWQADHSKDVISISVGYVPERFDVDVDGKSFSIFADKESLWTTSPAEDAALAKAVSAGKTLTVRATSKRGTETTDVYDLKESATAYKAISSACSM